MAEGLSNRMSALSVQSEESTESRSTARGTSSSPKPSPKASPILLRKDDVSSVGTGSEASPTTARRRELDVLVEAQAHTSLPGDPPLLPGELLSYIEHKITYLDHFLGSIEGTVYITSYKMYFKSDPNPKNTEESVVLNVPLGVISHVEKIGRSRQKGDNVIYGLDVHCKDMRTLRFAFAHNQESHGRRGMYDRLQIVAFPCSYGKNVYAFHFRGDYPDDGWEVYDPEAELKRMGVGNDGVPWRICHLNKNYELCDTYTSTFAVPLNCSDEMVQGVAQFRSKGRIPVLSWLHPVTQASITRCSQPLVGTMNRRSKEDEQYMQEILKANDKSNKLYILDARPKINAMTNVAMGGGYEHEDCYVNMDFSFLDIGNIHVMRESLKKLREICYPDVDDQRWFSNLESSHWLDHIKAILCGAVKVVECIETHKSSVVVHCTDGWDRTAQITSLSMLMMDSYFRTIKGFEVLVEKEWLGCGHKFSQRTGHGDKNHSDDQRSPIFVQFIDCVWQLMEQFPTAFEFNEHFLITILDHLYSCLFGTFLYNCERLRAEAGVKDKTVSLWSFVNSQIDVYKNPLYAELMNNKVLFPRTSIRILKLWTGYYMRWNPRMKPQESEFERSRQLQILIKLLKEKCQELTEQQRNITAAVLNSDGSTHPS